MDEKRAHKIRWRGKEQGEGVVERDVMGKEVQKAKDEEVSVPMSQIK